MFSNYFVLKRLSVIYYRWIAIFGFSLGVVLLLLLIGYYSISTLHKSQLTTLEYQSTYSNQIHPGDLIPAKYWHDPRWADVTMQDSTLNDLTRGFEPIYISTVSDNIGLAPVPTKLSIPSIGLQSQIKELDILTINDSRAWETPKHIAGHIPHTSRPGEKGILYLFGHLHSPIKGEGSVFRNLTQIPELLKDGHTVYLTVENKYGISFLYDITDTTVVHEDDFAIRESSGSSITLVACVPKYVYDHRLLVSGNLIGIKQ